MQRSSYRLIFRLALLLFLALAVAAAPQTGVASRMAVSAPQQGAFAPFVDIVPDLDGTELLVNARGEAPPGATLFANLLLGGSSHKGGYTMTYSQTAELYQVAVGGIASTPYLSGTLDISTTSGLSSAELPFERVLVPADALPGQAVVTSPDGLFSLSLPNAGTLPSDTYVVTIGGQSPPGPLPADRRLIGAVYSSRGPATLLDTAKPMILTLCYQGIPLGDATPAQLRIAAWTGSGWQILSGALLGNQPCLSSGVTRFTTYALVAPASDPPASQVYLPVLSRPHP